MNKQFSRYFVVLLGLIGAVTLSACYVSSPSLKLETARRLASPAFMFERQIKAQPFVLTVFERVKNRGDSITVYIEGDGQAYVSRNVPSMDPSPLNPIALHLASRDNSANIVYIARPCQYTKMMDPNVPCTRAYWMGSRFAPEVIDSMNAALNDIKSRYKASQFNLVGFSGGGAVAVLLASVRNDIASIRTVGGNLDPDTVATIHGVSPLTQSLNPRNVAKELTHIPQHHFIGDHDRIVPSAVFDSYRSAAGESTCIRSSFIRNTDHENGWVDVWPELLKAPLDCNAQP